VLAFPFICIKVIIRNQHSLLTEAQLRCKCAATNESRVNDNSEKRHWLMPLESQKHSNTSQIYSNKENSNLAMFFPFTVHKTDLEK